MGRINLNVAFSQKDIAKSLGARWDPAMRTWWAPSQEIADKIKARLPKQEKRGLPHGELWQECYCGTEPCCVNCERCARHCTC